MELGLGRLRGALMLTGDNSPSHLKLPWLGDLSKIHFDHFRMASRIGFNMSSIPRAYSKLSVALALTSFALFTTSASGQSPATGLNSTDKPIVAAQGSQIGSADNSVGSEPKPGSANDKVAADKPKSKDLKDEIEAVKAENAVVRELLRKMEEQQKTLLEQVDRLQRRLDGGTATDASTAGLPIVSPTTADATSPVTNGATVPVPTTDSASTSTQPVAAQPAEPERYQQGIILWKTPDDAKVPFLVNFNVNTQLRYLNTLNSKETFTDHLGNVREVHTRNDIT